MISCVDAGRANQTPGHRVVDGVPAERARPGMDFAEGKLDMPIFEFKCAKCGHVMEVLQKSRTGEVPVCEKCGGSDLKKLLSGFAVGKTAAAPACDSCFNGPTCGGGCPGGSCPLS
jgi:putative FmdB family regulatory protein